MEGFSWVLKISILGLLLNNDIIKTSDLVEYSAQPQDF